MEHFFSCFKGFLSDLKSDGHGNGGTLINGNGGTHYHLSIQEIIIHHKYQLLTSINILKYILATHSG